MTRSLSTALLFGLALSGALLVSGVAAAAQATATKLISPVRGEAELGYTKPVSKNDGKMVTTTIRVKNLSAGPIAGLKVDEFWYDAGGEPVTGSPSFRYRKPLMPGEVIDVVLKVPVNPKMKQPQWKFEHSNGKIKPKLLPKL